MSKCGELIGAFCEYSVPGEDMVAYSERFINLDDEEADALAESLIPEIKEKYGLKERRN